MTTDTSIQDWIQALQRGTLDSICQESVTQNIELFKPNQYYGNAAIIKRYAGWPLERPLKAVLEHGIYIDRNDFTAGGELDALLPMFLPTSNKRAATYAQKSKGKPAIAIGSSFLYTRALLEPHLPSVRPQGTLVFPSHSTRYIKKVFDHQAYAAKLAALPPQFHPIAVCIYWKDYQDGDHQAYANQGFEIISAGHMLDPDFIARFYLNCRRFRYACSNEIGTHLFYSVTSGCRFFMYPCDDEIRWVADEERHLASHPRDDVMNSGINDLFSQPVEETTSEQQRFIDYYMGTNCMRSPQALYSLLKQSEWLDKMRFYSLLSCMGKPASWFCFLPTYWQRKLDKKRAKKEERKRLTFSSHQ